MCVRVRVREKEGEKEGKRIIPAREQCNYQSDRVQTTCGEWVALTRHRITIDVDIVSRQHTDGLRRELSMHLHVFSEAKPRATSLNTSFRGRQVVRSSVPKNDKIFKSSIL